MRTVAVVALLVALTGQFAWVEWQRRPLPFKGPVVGRALDNVDLQIEGARSDLRRLVERPGGCTLLVIVSTTCPVCQRMRYSWPRRFAIWRDSISSSMQAVWLAPQEAAEQSTFYEGFNYKGIRRGQLLSGTGGKKLGVIGTPTAYLLDSSGRLRIGILGDILPPADSAARVCR